MRIDKTHENADWCFSKDDVNVVCEVKTIFSGGLKEAEFAKFYEELSLKLRNDPQISHLPFDVRIYMNTLYIPYGIARETFIAWIVSFVLGAAQHHVTEQYPYDDTVAKFMFEGQYDSRIPSADVEVRGPFSEGELQIAPPPFGALPYNEKGVRQNLEKAISQLDTSAKLLKLPDALRIIAFWSESSNISAGRFAMEMIGLRSGDTPERYNLFDWAFMEYKDLAAIIFFRLHDTKRNTEFWRINFDTSSLFPYGLIIPNPFINRGEQVLRHLFTDYCSFVEAITLKEDEA